MRSYKNLRTITIPGEQLVDKSWECAYNTHSQFLFVTKLITHIKVPVTYSSFMASFSGRGLLI
jgi:hypothetical protein